MGIKITTLKELLENEDEILSNGSNQVDDKDIDYSDIPRMDDPNLWAKVKLINPHKPKQLTIEWELMQDKNDL